MSVAATNSSDRAAQTRRVAGSAPTVRSTWIQDSVTTIGVRPSFLTGIASLWDFAGLLVPRVRANRQSSPGTDADALAADWDAVAQDMEWTFPPSDEDDAIK